MRLIIYLFFSLGTVLSVSAQDKNNGIIAPLHFTKMKLSSETYESAGVFDVNGDGNLDVVSGAFWYEGPLFVQRYLITEIKRVGEYWDDFSTIHMDINGDGKLDLVSGGWFGETLYWWENPGNNKPWKQHVIDHTGHIETARAWDIDGDGIQDIVPNNPGLALKYYKLNRDAQGKGTGSFEKIEIAPTQGHGLGFGDINGDKRGDIILNKGWLEALKDPKGSWTLHEEFDFKDASVPILVADVNKDGLQDLIVGQAHGYGLDWYEQQKDAQGKRIWKKHPIDPYNSQYHTMEWEDIDGDGEPELITGKRYRAHNGGDPGAGDPFGLYYFKWNGESFTKNVISYGPVDLGKGAGIYFSIADLRKSGRKDIIVAGKDGLYIFFNEGSR